MHETSLGQTIRDYLTGEEIENTSYEDFRQALARLLVEELGYPRDRLRPKVGITFPLEGRDYCRVADLVAYDDAGRPLLLILFGAGQPGSFDRELLAAARLLPGGPAPLAAATNTEDAVLHAAADGRRLATGMSAIPRWDRLQALAAEHPAAPMTADRAERERRILFTYSEFLASSCRHTCRPRPSG
ncbi:MAG: type I restriction enzyme HsdR N-terminal domain-containing protein [Thermodesulfobacteriota bacterium]